MSTKRSPTPLPQVTPPPEVAEELREALDEARDPAKLRKLTPEQLARMVETGEWPESLD